jgi:hypothetical protein
MAKCTLQLTLRRGRRKRIFRQPNPGPMMNGSLPGLASRGSLIHPTPGLRSASLETRSSCNIINSKLPILARRDTVLSVDPSPIISNIAHYASVLETTVSAQLAHSLCHSANQASPCCAQQTGMYIRCGSTAYYLAKTLSVEYLSRPI